MPELGWFASCALVRVCATCGSRINIKEEQENDD